MLLQSYYDMYNSRKNPSLTVYNFHTWGEKRLLVYFILSSYIYYYTNLIQLVSRINFLKICNFYYYPARWCEIKRETGRKWLNSPYIFSYVKTAYINIHLDTPNNIKEPPFSPFTWTVSRRVAWPLRLLTKLMVLAQRAVRAIFSVTLQCLKLP